MASVFQALVKAGYFHKHCEVPSWPYGECNFRDLHFQNSCVMFFKPDPFILPVRAPFFKINHEFNSGFIKNVAYAEQASYINYAQPPDLHMMADDLLALADKYSAGTLADLNHIVGHQHMAPFHKFQCALGFSNTGIAHQHDAKTVNAYQHAVH